MRIDKLLIILFLYIFICLPHALANEVLERKNGDNYTIAKEYLAANFALKNGDYWSAAELFEQALLKNPQDILLLSNTYKSMLLAGNYEKAAKYAQEYLKYDKESIDAVLLVTIYSLRNNDFTGASVILEGVEHNKNHTQNIEIEQLIMPFVRTWIVAGEGNYDVALGSLDPHDIGNIVSDTFVILQKALLYSLSGNQDLAEQTFAPLIDAKGLMPYHLAKSAASFYESIGKWDEAGRIYAQYRATHPSLTHFEYVSMRVTDKVTEGLYIKNPKAALAEVMKEVARFLFASGIYRDGMVYLRLALILEPYNEEANMLLANSFEVQKNWTEAIALYNKIPVGSDFYYEAQINKAEDLYSIGSKAEAKELLLDIAKNTKTKYIPLVILADLLRRDAAYAEASEIYTKILQNIDINSKVSWAIYFGRGMCLERSGQWKIAEKDFLRALELSPNQPEVLNYLAYSWIEHNENLEKAKDMLLKAVVMRPADPQILDSAGWALYKMKDYKNAIVFLEKSTQLLPQDAVMNDHLGDIYWMLGRKYEARYQWQRAIKYGPAESSSQKQLENKIINGLI